MTTRNESSPRARAARPPGARRTRARARGTRSGARPGARATPAGSRRWTPPPACGCGTRCRSTPRGTSGSTRRPPRSPPARRVGGAARAATAPSSAAIDAVVEHDRRREPRPAVDDPVPHRVGAAQPAIASATSPASARSIAGRSAVSRTASSGPSSRSLSVLEPALTTRIRPAGVGHAQFAISGAVLSLERVYARAWTACRPSVAHVAGLRREPGHPVDDVHHEVEPVEVVEHDHVERRRGRALLLVAAHVDVAVVGPPVGEAVDEPRIAVVGEDDRLVRGEERVELRIGQPCGCSLSGCSRIGSTTLTTRTRGRADAVEAGRPRPASRASARRRPRPSRRRGRRPRRCSPTPRCRCRACSAGSPRPSTASWGSAACPRRSTFT